MDWVEASSASSTSCTSASDGPTAGRSSGALVSDIVSAFPSAWFHRAFELLGRERGTDNTTAWRSLQIGDPAALHVYGQAVIPQEAYQCEVDTPR